MMGLTQIVEESRRAAVKAARNHQKPFVPFVPEEVKYAPFLGTYIPNGWRLATYADLPEFKDRHGFYGNSEDLGVLLFCDSAGFGPDDEPALSVRLRDIAVADIARALPGLTVGFGIYEVGQFQLHLRVFIREE